MPLRMMSCGGVSALCLVPSTDLASNERRTQMGLDQTITRPEALGRRLNPEEQTGTNVGPGQVGPTRPRYPVTRAVKQDVTIASAEPVWGAMNHAVKTLGIYGRIDCGEKIGKGENELLDRRSVLYQGSDPATRAKLKQDALKLYSENGEAEQRIYDELMRSD
jgi:hypothetical protein